MTITKARRLLIYISHLCLIALLLSCKSSQIEVSENLENSFSKAIGIENLNKFFEVHLVSGEENFRFGSDIRISLYNSSGEKILFSVGYGIKLFVVYENNWLEIENKNKYSGEEVYLPSVSNQDLGARLVTGIRPVLPLNIDLREKTILRILIQGVLIYDKSNNNIPVGAFVDVYVEP